ncbi:MAG: hypothetical protein ACRCST_03155 [Turicibacter sp.]
MIKKIISAIAIQSLGTVASFATVWFITNKYGLSIQGNFAIIKSWIDLMVVIGSLGFAQSFSYAINKLNVDRVKLKTFSIIYVILFFPFIFLLTKFFAPKEIAPIGLVAFSACLLIQHALFRGIYLTINDGLKFSIASILPAITLLFAIYITNFLIGEIDIYNAYLFSGTISVFIVFVFLKSFRFDFFLNEIPWKIIIKNGNSVFLQSVSICLLPVVTFYILKRGGATDDDIGVLSIANYFYMAFALPFNMIAPILFNKWAKSNNGEETKNEVRKILYICIFVFALSILSISLLPMVINLFFDSAGNKEKIIECSSIMLFAAVPLFLSRVITAYLQALGRFSYVSLSYSIKTAFCIIAIAVLFFVNFVNINDIAIIWVLGEIVLLLMLYVDLKVANKGMQ